MKEQLKEGKIKPSQTGLLNHLAMREMATEKTYEKDGLKKEYASNLDVIKDIIALNDSQDFSETSETTDVNKKEYEEEDVLDKKIREYSKENNVSYNEAFKNLKEGDL